MVGSNEWKPTPKIFRRRQYVVEAVQVEEDNRHKVATWCGGLPTDDPYVRAYISEVNKALVLIPRLGEVLGAEEGEWVVRDEDGLYSVVSDRNFRQKFHYVPEDNHTDVGKSKQDVIF